MNVESEKWKVKFFITLLSFVGGGFPARRSLLALFADFCLHSHY